MSAIGLAHNTKLFYAAQYLFGGRFLFHRLNYWPYCFPQPGAGDPGVRPMDSKATLTGKKQVLTILFGIAIPAAVTYASLLFVK